jgi:hypothetical protein
MHLQRGAFSHGGNSSHGGPCLSAPAGILPSPGFENPAWIVGKYGVGRWREDGGHPQWKVHRPTLWLNIQTTYWSFKTHGAKGTCGSLSGTKDRTAGPSRTVPARCIKTLRLTLGFSFDDVEAGDDKRTLKAAGDRCRGESFRSSATTRPRGDCEERRRILLSGSPRHVFQELDSFTQLYSHTRRRWGSIGSRGTSADRDCRGGAIVRNSKGSTAGVRVRGRKTCAWASFRLGKPSSMPSDPGASWLPRASPSRTDRA